MQAVIVNEKNPALPMQIGEWPKPIPKEEEILVKVKSTALNRADLLQRRGKYPPPKGASPLLGLEYAGEVAAVGSKVTKWKPGDKVCGLLAGGAYAEYILSHADLAMPIPVGLNFEEAAALPEVFMTAYQALFWLAYLKPEESILIHAGASGVGTAAIQLAKSVGAEIFVTASKSKHQLCYDLGAKHCIDYKTAHFVEKVQELNSGKGVDVIIDFIGAQYFMPNIQALASDGRMLMLGFLSGFVPQEVNLAPILLKRLKIMGSTLRARELSYKIRLKESLQRYAWKSFENKDLKPVIDSVFPMKAVNEAHERMAQNLNQGKIILKWE